MSLSEFLPPDASPLWFGLANAHDTGAALLARALTVIRPETGLDSTPAAVLEAATRAMRFALPNRLCVTLFHPGLDVLPWRKGCAGTGHGLRAGENDSAAAEPSPFPTGSEWRADDIIVLTVGGLVGATATEARPRWAGLLQTHPPLSPAQVFHDLRHFLREPGKASPEADALTLLVIQHQPRRPSPPEQAAWQWHIAMSSDLSRLAQVRRRLANILSATGLGTGVIQDTQLIVEELLANTIRYGCTASSPCHINMRFHLTAAHLEMCFEDTAPSFNPLVEIAPPDLCANDEARALGGFGFYLVRKLAERIDYAHRDGRNVLTVALALSAKP
ncbi:ATP-binding protein [Methylomagnum sp.]